MSLKTCLSKFTYLLISFLLIASPVFSQSTILDVSFGNAGKVTTPINDTATANAVAVQTDGKIIAGGYTILAGRYYSTLVRYNVNGSLDNTFGSGGKVVTQLTDTRSINAVALQPDGKIVAGGTTNNGFVVNGDFTLIRYKTDGSIDSLFGNNGIAKAALNGSGTVTKIMIKPDGKILAGGTLGLPTFDNIPALAQFKTNGAVDSSFGVNGEFQDYVSNDTIRVLSLSDMAMASDGKIVATGETNGFRSAFTLFRFLANGTLNSSFGVRGLVTTGFYNTYGACQSKAIAVQPDNKMVVAGYSYNLQTGTRFSMTRYNTTGSLDSTFGTDGKVIAQPGTANHILVDPAGNLILTGYTSETGTADFAVARYFSNGKPDSAFSSNGMLTTDFSGFRDQSFSSVIQPDGKIMVAGQAANNTTYSIALARFTMFVLPLKLLNFTALKDGKNNFLQWNTAQEINIDRFEIERSADGKDYSSIGKINGGSGKYNFTDVKPLNGIYYYRLQMIDRDGQFEYSPVRIVISNSANFYVNIYPVPANSKLNIEIISNQTEKADVSVSDVSGKIVIRSQLSFSPGTTNTFLTVGSLTAGVYFLKIVTPQATETRKIVIVRN